MAIVINNTIKNENVSVRENLTQSILEASKTLNTVLSATNLALVYSVSELTDIEYNTHNGLIRPLQTLE
jgi:hypothetical protein